MHAVRHFLDIFLHLRENIGGLIGQYGPHIYTIFFIVIFIETGRSCPAICSCLRLALSRPWAS